MLFTYIHASADDMVGKIINFAVPRDSRIEEREKEKIEKYQDLRRESQKIWNVRMKIIPLAVGSYQVSSKIS